MVEHRFRQHLKETAPPQASTAAFMPCPLFTAFAPMHQAFVAGVYQLAQQMTEAQTAKPQRPLLPAFSVN